MRRPAFLQQLMLSCENECTLSALCTKAHTRKFPVFTVSKAMQHSGGHLAVLFYIFFHHKTWCSCVSCDALVILSDKSATRGYSSSFVPPRYFPKLCKKKVFISLDVKQEKAKRYSEEISCSLNTTPISSYRSDDSKEKKWSEMSLCTCSNVMMWENFCTFSNPSSSPQCAVSKQHTIWYCSLSGLFSSICCSREPL